MRKSKKLKIQRPPISTIKDNVVVYAVQSMRTLGHRSLIIVSPHPRACATTSRMAQTDAEGKLSNFHEINLEVKNNNY